MAATSPEAPPALAGRTVAVTAERRSQELINLLERRGASTYAVPMLHTVPLPEDRQLADATARCLDTPLDDVVVMTGVGFTGWMDVAKAGNVHAKLLERIGDARILARGAKAGGAIRAHGLRENWSAPGETSTEVLAELVATSVAGRTIAVQVHGAPMPTFVEPLTAAGATVIEIQVYRWLPPPDPAAVADLVHRVVDGAVDAVTFTSAPAAANLLSAAEEHGLLAELKAAFATQVVAACVGAVTAAPLTDAGVPTVQPERARVKALVDTVVEALASKNRDANFGIDHDRQAVGDR